ncbi:MAG: endolytic transglycosylase MltG [Clostridia bacterium]
MDDKKIPQKTTTSSTNKTASDKKTTSTSKTTPKTASTTSKATASKRTSAKKPAPKGNNIVRKKKHVRSGLEVIRATVLYIMFVLAVSSLLSFIAIKVANDMFAFVKDDKEVIVTIPDNATISQVTSIVTKAGIVEYGPLFNLFVQISASGSSFTEGTHELNTNLDYRGLLNELAKNTTESLTVETVNVTVPEGYTLEQIATLMEEKDVVTYDEFIDTAINYPFSHTFLQEQDDVIYQLEGYLFPDTYEFYVGDNPVSVINKMLNNFDDKTWELSLAIENGEFDYTLHELITIASLIEREAAKVDEQATISGVIHNRLESSAYPFLNIDASIQYASGHREEILQSDLDKDGPYNTYTRTGLPAGPIANAGIDAILSAFEPESHGYYFYVAKDDGYHIFTKTLAEHNAAVASVRN